MVYYLTAILFAITGVLVILAGENIKKGAAIKDFSMAAAFLFGNNVYNPMVFVIELWRVIYAIGNKGGLSPFVERYDRGGKI